MLLILLFAFSVNVIAQVTFTKDDYADWTLEENQDRITDIVWITRQDSDQLFNIYSEDEAGDVSPEDTEWVEGSTYVIDFADYTDFEDAHGGSASSLPGETMSMHLITDDLYFDVLFNDWTSGKDGGGFSYTRTPVTKFLNYSPTTFEESLDNNGSIQNSLTITMIIPGGDSFSGSNGTFVASKYTASNVPAGLTMVITRIGDTELSVSLTGSATDHKNADDISNLEIAFNNTAFTNGDAGAELYLTDTATDNPNSETTIFPYEYQTRAAGNWNSITLGSEVWERRTSGSSDAWVTVTDAADLPDYGDESILVKHNVTVTASVEIDQTTVNSGNTLAVNSGVTLTINNGDGTDLTSEGTLDINGTISIGTAMVDANGTFDATGGAVTFTDAGYLNLGGTVTSLGTFTKSTSMVTYDGDDQAIMALDYSTLALSSTTSDATKTFADGTTKVDNEISLTGSDITISMTLTGSSASAVTVQVTAPGVTTSSVFSINAPGDTVYISNMTIKGGVVTDGGGIQNVLTTLNLDTVTVSGSKATSLTNGGGGIYNFNGTLTLTNSTVSGNTADGAGGGIYNFANVTSSLTLTNSTVSENTANGAGGGISNYSEMGGTPHLTLNNSTIANNHSDNDNSVGEQGGGVYLNDGTLEVKNTIIANNYTGSATVTRDDYFYNAGTLTDNGYNVVENSNVAANATGGFNNVTSILYNTKYNNAGTSFTSWTQGGDPVSGSLSLSETLALNNNPNGTWTLSYTDVSSIGIDDGTGTGTDQRGAAVYNSTKDIGAYEWQGSEGTLPVILSSFTFQYLNESPVLCWTTQSETSNAGWNIYRSQTDILEEAMQINFEMIPGAGTTSEPTDYIYEDESELMENTEYWYWLETIDYSGLTGSYGPISLIIPEEGEEPGSPEIPGIYGLHQNYPNPFNPHTEISFMMKESCFGELSIYNVKGEKVSTLFQNKSVPKDELIRTNWNGKDESGKEVSSGVYYYKLRTTKGNFVRKMILLK